MKITFIAIDRETSGTFTETFNVESKKDVDDVYKEFETHVPFRKWYLETDSNAKTEEEFGWIENYYCY